MHNNAEFVNTLEDVIRKRGAMDKLISDSAKVEKWFRRNCKDVLARECTAAEKADVLAWLMTLR